jgi:3D-(3,5/4)-trihydroxycyclohexane-1,2-dione acylhydrolase (decyclizing)
VLVIETDPAASTEAGGHWWEVAVPQVSQRQQVRAAHERYTLARQRRFDED